MYSHEIEQLLELKKNIITDKEYLKILKTSPQINHVKYDNYSSDFYITTDDKYNFKFKVKRKS